MSILSRLEILVDFLRDIFFDSPEEANLVSSKFNPRKFTVFIMVICMMSLNAFLINRVFYLVKKIQRQQNTLNTCQPYFNEPVIHPVLPNIPFKS